MHHSDQAPGTGWNLLFICWLIAVTSALGSLFFSEVMKFAPCVLCWYQRICLFPLVLILTVGLFPFDKSVVKFALPLAIAGWFVAFYHNLLYTGIIPESLQPCSKGVSCTEDYINLFGIFSIPMLSLMSFSAIAILLFMLKRRFRNEEAESNEETEND
ncbi:MAG: disulfide bond formation protein B [Nitrospirae bacterium]|nr:disulfide bond formation protein B [Nitrospirota bacterium]